ncbi:P4HA2 [Symbiodinium natans]|uniref:P4HA2 protein n=1 Tax=Symbiodinium natans TaxID=878477 RepID=A0A812N5C4_9DINO|nr:P4HA2 [Symbiodinium natans]
MAGSLYARIVTLDNFISDEESKLHAGLAVCRLSVVVHEGLVALLAQEIDGLLSVASTFQRSADQGEKNPFGMTEGLITKHRTSQTAWCDEECKGAPVFHRVRDRISEMIGVPWRNFETMQFLKYNVGEEYARHHDMHNLTDNHFASGPRIYTFFLYMSDVEEGGETQFTELNISVRPRKGSALLWPSVKSQNPTVQDERTMHAARPVKNGSKVAANVWVHLFDFEVSSIWACTGGLRDVR